MDKYMILTGAQHQSRNRFKAKPLTIAAMLLALHTPSTLADLQTVNLNERQWTVRGSQTPTERQYLDQQSPLRWQAVESFELQQAAFVELTLQPNQMIRLQDLTPAEYEQLVFWQDNGSGLWLRVQPEQVNYLGQSQWLWRAPVNAPYLLRIQRKAAETSPLILKLRRSMQWAYSLAGQFRLEAVDPSSGHPLSDHVKPVSLQDQRGRELDFYHVAADQVLNLLPAMATGAESHPTTGSQEPARYRLTVRPLWQGMEPKQAELELVLENAQGQTLRWLPDQQVDEQWQTEALEALLIGRPQQLELGPDTLSFQLDAVRLRSNQPVLIQLQRLTQPFLNSGNAFSSLISPDTDDKNSLLAQDYPVARASAIRNDVQESALATRAQLSTTEPDHGQTRTSQWQEALLKQHTVYETLLPLNAGGQLTATYWTALREGTFPEGLEAAITQVPTHSLSTSLATQQAAQWQYLQGLKSIPFTQWRFPSGAAQTPDHALLKGEILFELDQFQLEAGFLPQLKALSEYLQQHPDDQLTLTGHTDAFASDQYNQTLSRKRVEVVQQHLVRLGVNPDRLKRQFSGATEHRTPNSRPEQRRLNRRVELWLHPKAKNNKGELVDVWLYPLPKRPAGSRVRLLLAESELENHSALQLNVQQDQQPPIEVQLNAQPLAARPEPAAMGLRLLAQHPAGAEGEQSALFQSVFGQSSGATAYQSARSAEFDIDASVQALRVWVETSSHTDEQVAAVSLAVQVRSQRPYRLSPEWLLQVPDTQRWAVFSEAIQRLKVDQQLPVLPQSLLQPKDWLVNHWVPVLRWLQDQRQRFALGVSPRSPQSVAAIQLAPLDQRLKRLAQARQAEANQNWSEALAHWHWLSYAASPKGRLMAERQHSHALLALGQKNSAEQQLKGLLLFGTAAEQQMAQQALIQLYQSSFDQTGLTQLYVDRFFSEPVPERLADLVDHLLRQGQDYYGSALAMALTAPLLSASPERLDHILQSLYRQNHWQAVSQWVEAYDHADKPFWKGMLAQAQGEYEVALALWQSGGRRSQQMAHYFQQGLAIQRSGLKTQAQQQAWLQWWYRTPLSWLWQNANHRVQAAAGSGLLQQQGSGDLAQVFLVNAEHELRIDGQGGGSLLLEVRPLHADYKNTPVSGWLSLHQGSRQWIHPLFSRGPSETVQLLGIEPAYQVGLSQQIRLNLEDLQTPVRLKTGGLPLLVSVKQAEPAVKLALLAQPKALQALTPEIFKVQYPDMAQSRAVQAVELRSTQQLNQQIQQAHSGSVDAAYQALTQLAWRSEQSPEQADLWLTHANALRQRYPSALDLSARAALVAGRWQWLPIDGVSRSAGTRFIQRDEWPSTSQGRRIQQSLIPPLSAAEQLFDAGYQLNYFIKHQGRQEASEHYELKLNLHPMRFYPAQEVLVDVLLDDKLINQVRLNGTRDQIAIRPNIPQGAHLLSLRLSQAWRNQLVSATLLQVQGQKRQALFPEPDTTRRFSVATAQEPILFRVQGPTLLKIERYSAGQLQTSYRTLASGWQTVRVSPAAGESQSAYRFYQQASQTAEMASEVAVLQAPSLQLPMAQPVTVPLSNSMLRLFDDPIDSQHQEGPTWSAYGQVALLKSAIDPELTQAEVMELGVERRHQYRDQHYTQFQLAGRQYVREGRSLDTSFTAQADWLIPYQPDTRLTLSGELAYQQQRYQLGLRGTGRWQAELVPAYWQNWFEAEWFYRSLSHQEGQDADFDPKVWSRYRVNHGYGVRLADQISYRPWLDAQLQLRAELISNTDLSLDRVRWRAAFYHQIQRWQWGLGYYGVQGVKDQHRTAETTEHKVQLELDADLWQDNWARWQLSAEAGLLWPNEQPYFSMRLSRHEANGRGLTDFTNQRFSALRSLNAPIMTNNRILTEPPLETEHANQH